VPAVGRHHHRVEAEVVLQARVGAKATERGEKGEVSWDVRKRGHREIEAEIEKETGAEERTGAGS
jgi:hypothetical protein